MTRKHASLIVAAVTIFVSSVGFSPSAGSVERQVSSANPPAHAVCAAYLDGSRSTVAVPATLTDHRSAGQAAAMSLMLNVSYSLGSEYDASSLADSERAQAITAYRQCRKRQALNEIAAAL